MNYYVYILVDDGLTNDLAGITCINGPSASAPSHPLSEKAKGKRPASSLADGEQVRPPKRKRSSGVENGTN